MLIIINNDTSATDYYFDVPEILYKELSNLEQDDLNDIFNPVSLGDWSNGNEQKSIYNDLVKYALSKNLIQDKDDIIALNPPYIFIDTGF